MFLECKCLHCGHYSQVYDDSLFAGNIILRCPNCDWKNTPKILCPKCNQVSSPMRVFFNLNKVRCSKFRCGYKGYPNEFTVVIK